MSLLLVSTAVLEGSNMTIGLTLEQAQIEGYAGTTTGAIFPTTNRACGYGVNRDYPAVEGDYIDSYTVYGKNADAGDEDFTIAVYDVSIGDLVAGSALTATIPPFTISPAKFTFDHVANTPLVAGTTYRVVAVAAGAQNVDFGNNFSVSGKTSEYQTATITNTLNDPFNPDTVHSQDLIMAAAVVNAPISGSPTLTTPYSIGTNNGPLFVATSSDSTSTVEGANFLDGNAGWASLLKTGDVVMIQCSNATKMYNVTVVKETRTITLSTGLAIS